MELRHLRYFIKAAELLHFTKAAESLYISQPTLSIHIQQLEDELGTELFIRSGRCVHLTETGETFLLHARKAMRELEIASEEISAISGLRRGNLSIEALPLFSRDLVPIWINVFNSDYPDVHVHARSGASEDIETAVTDGRIDLGFSILPIEHDELSKEELFSDYFVLIVSKAHKLANKDRLEVSDLHNLRLAMAGKHSHGSRILRKYFAEIGVQPNIVVEYDDGPALLEIAIDSPLAATVPRFGYIDTRVCTKLLPGPGLNFTAAALWTHLTPSSRAFLDVVKKTIAAQAAHRDQ